MLQDKNWHTGSNLPIDLTKIKEIVVDYVSRGAKIYIGSDSFITQGKFVLHQPSVFTVLTWEEDTSFSKNLKNLGIFFN